jgi:hypothetical protein
MLNMAPPTTKSRRAKGSPSSSAVLGEAVRRAAGSRRRGTRSAAGEAPPLAAATPSVQYDLAKLDRRSADRAAVRRGSIPVDHVRTGELRRRPTPAADDDRRGVNAWLATSPRKAVSRPTALVWSRQGGALGSACLTWCIVEGEFEFEAHKSKHCTPTFHPRKRSKSGEAREALHLPKPEESRSDHAGAHHVREVDYWHRETWDETAHIVLRDVPVGDGKDPTWIEDDAAVHGFGFVPGRVGEELDDGEPSSIDGVSLIEGLDRTCSKTSTARSRRSRARSGTTRIPSASTSV